MKYNIKNLSCFLMLFSCAFFVNIPQASSKAGCKWLSIYCGGGMGSWESYCANASGNTNVGCPCGTIVKCGNHGS